MATTYDIYSLDSIITFTNTSSEKQAASLLSVLFYSLSEEPVFIGQLCAAMIK